MIASENQYIAIWENSLEIYLWILNCCSMELPVSSPSSVSLCAVVMRPWSWLVQVHSSQWR